jgi:hypothetical protein
MSVGFLLAALAQVSDPFHFDLRLTLGGEWDTNAKRAVPNATEVAGAPPSDVVGDGLARLLVDTRVRIDLAPGHRLTGAYLLGAKRFFVEQTEDLLVNSLTLASVHSFASWLGAAISGAGKLSRIRSSSRDYDLGLGDASVFVTPLRWMDIEARGGLAAFRFPAERDFDYLGPHAGGGLRFRPVRGLSAAAGFDWVWRFYRGNAQQIDAQSMLVSCIDVGGECQRRTDTEAQVSASIAYQADFVCGGGYLVRLQRSNDDLENVDRHRLSTFATIQLPLHFTVNVLAALQINSGVSATDTKFLAEDDENQNSVQVGLTYSILDGLEIDARYALFANQFATNDVSFIRQTVYLGVAYRAGE